MVYSGRSRDFQTGGVRLCQSEGTYQIFMAFSLLVVGCSLKKGLQMRVGGSRAPQDPPGYAFDIVLVCGDLQCGSDEVCVCSYY